MLSFMDFLNKLELESGQTRFQEIRSVGGAHRSVAQFFTYRVVRIASDVVSVRPGHIYLYEQIPRASLASSVPARVRVRPCACS